MLMSLRSSPRFATIWTCPRTALLFARLDVSLQWTPTQDKAATSGGLFAVTLAFIKASLQSRDLPFASKLLLDSIKIFFSIVIIALHM